MPTLFCGYLDELFRLARDKGNPFGGDIIQAHDEHRAEQLLKDGMVRLRIDDSNLPDMPGCSPEKYALAWLVRRKTSVKVEWIKKRLRMGRATYFSAWLKKLESARPGDWGHGCLRKVRKIN